MNVCMYVNVHITYIPTWQKKSVMPCSEDSGNALCVYPGGVSSFLLQWSFFTCVRLVNRLSNYVVVVWERQISSFLHVPYIKLDLHFLQLLSSIRIGTGKGKYAKKRVNCSLASSPLLSAGKQDLFDTIKTEISWWIKDCIACQDRGVTLLPKCVCHGTNYP